MRNRQTEPNKEGVHLLYKHLGETPNERILRWKKENSQYNDVSATYAGRLDPMAEGLLLVLSGDAILDKQSYIDLEKTYHFEMLWGFETDTHDILGLVTNKSEVIPEEAEGINEIKNKIGKFEQNYPAYSSKPVLGKPLFQWARESKIGEIEIPKHEVGITSAEFISRKVISKEELLRNISEKIYKVQGDFRQKDILIKWQESIENSNLITFTIDSLSISVSSGFYVRQFVSDFSALFNSLATTFHIKRTKIGEFDVKNAV